MKLTIIKPDQIQEYTIQWIEVITDQGSFVIQDEHAPTVFVLASGKLMTFRLATGVEESLFVMQGVVEVSRKAVLALIGESQ